MWVVFVYVSLWKKGLNVHVSRLFFHRISWQFGSIYSDRLGMEKDTPHTFDNHWPYYVFLVRFRNILWMGVLPLYGLALGD
jgi:hypothetical protein